MSVIFLASFIFISQVWCQSVFFTNLVLITPSVNDTLGEQLLGKLEHVLGTTSTVIGKKYGSGKICVSYPLIHFGI